MLESALANMYLKCGNPEHVADMWISTPSVKLNPNIYPIVLSACVELQDLEILKMITTYVETWNPLNEKIQANIIVAYIKIYDTDKAKSLWNDITAKFDPPLSNNTYTSILSACASTANTTLTKHIYNHFTTNNILPSVLISNSLIDAFGKCGDINEAFEIFMQMKSRGDQITQATWSAMMGGL